MKNTSRQSSPNLSRRAHLASLLALSSGLWASHASGNASGIPIAPLPEFPTTDPRAHGRALAEYAELYDSGWRDQYMVAKMTLFDARGDSIQRAISQMLLEGSDGDRALVRFMAPAEIRGVGALIHEHPTATDDSWLYLPASRRVRRISGANRSASFQGTEFTYEDLSSFSSSRYEFRFLGRGRVHGEPVYELEATPRYADTGYSRLVMSLHQREFRTETIQFFDLAGRKLKTLDNSRWSHVHERFWRARRLEVENHQTGKRTLIELESLFVNLALYPRPDGSSRDSLTPARFTKRALQAG